MIDNFGKIGGFKYAIDEEPGKYIEKIKRDDLYHHPMYEYLNYKISNLNTLDGEGQTRYSILA